MDKNNVSITEIDRAICPSCDSESIVVVVNQKGVEVMCSKCQSLGYMRIQGNRQVWMTVKNVVSREEQKNTRSAKDILFDMGDLNAHFHGLANMGDFPREKIHENAKLMQRLIEELKTILGAKE